MLILAAIVAIFVYGMIAAMLGTILPELSDRFHLTPTQNGTIAFAQALGLIIASVGVGPLLDNEGDKIGLILGLVFIAIALFLLPRSRGFSSIVLLLFLLGVGGGIVVTGANALVSGVSEAHRGTALNLVNLFFGLGGLTTPFISANLFKRNWVRLCYTVASLTAVTVLIQVFTKMPAPVSGSGFILADAGPVLGRPLLFMLGFFLFLYISCEVGVWNWLPRHLIAQGIPESRAPVFPTTLAIVGTAFPRMTGTAMGFVMTCGWAGLAVSSRIIGAIAGNDPLRLKKALLLIPASAVLMIGLNLAIRSML